MKRLLPLLFLLVGVAAFAQDVAILPDPDRTPGMIDKRVTSEDMDSTICVPGYTKIVRPPPTYTNHLKAQQMKAWDLPGTAADYEEDHRVPLCIGGHPRSPKNLWPQPRSGQWNAAIKDQLEASVCRAVCHGDMTLEQGQAIFLAPDWTEQYSKFFSEQ
jgi:hypothetical protein